MAILPERMEQIASGLKSIRLQLGIIQTEELKEIIRDAERDEAIGPMLDPTRWRDEDLFTSVRKTRKVLGIMVELKRELEGG